MLLLFFPLPLPAWPLPSLQPGEMGPGRGGSTLPQHVPWAGRCPSPRDPDCAGVPGTSQQPSPALSISLVPCGTSMGQILPASCSQPVESRTSSVPGVGAGFGGVPAHAPWSHHRQPLRSLATPPGSASWPPPVGADPVPIPLTQPPCAHHPKKPHTGRVCGPWRSTSAHFKCVLLELLPSPGAPL